MHVSTAMTFTLWLYRTSKMHCGHTCSDTRDSLGGSVLLFTDLGMQGQKRWYDDPVQYKFLDVEQNVSQLRALLDSEN